jgi:hypothetical protein
LLLGTATGRRLMRLLVGSIVVRLGMVRGRRELARVVEIRVLGG